MHVCVCTEYINILRTKLKTEENSNDDDDCSGYVCALKKIMVDEANRPTRSAKRWGLVSSIKTNNLANPVLPHFAQISDSISGIDFYLTINLFIELEYSTYVFIILIL